MTRDEQLKRLLQIARLRAERAAAPIAQAQRAVDAAERAVEDGVQLQHRLRQGATDPVFAAHSAARLRALRLAQADKLARLARARVALEEAQTASRLPVARRLALEAALTRSQKGRSRQRR